MGRHCKNCGFKIGPKATACPICDTVVLKKNRIPLIFEIFIVLCIILWLNSLLNPTPSPEPAQSDHEVLNPPLPRHENKQKVPEESVISKLKAYHAAKNNNYEFTPDILPSIRKRVLRTNEYLSNRIANGYIPELPLDPVEEAAYDQLALNAKSIIPDKGFLAECFYDSKGRDNSNKHYIVCNMFFPGEYTIGNVPMHYVHYIESVSSNVAHSFNQEANPSSFWVMALVNIQGKFVPICSFIYDKELNSLTPIYNVQ